MSLFRHVVYRAIVSRDSLRQMVRMFFAALVSVFLVETISMFLQLFLFFNRLMLSWLNVYIGID